MPEPIAPDVVYHLTTLASPSLSPDGSRLAFAQGKVDREAMEGRTHIKLMDLGTGETCNFTQGQKDGSPSFSPDGKALAFLRPDDNSKAQVWVMAISGGEARQLTSLPGGVTEFFWAPGSEALALVSDVDPAAAEGPEESKEPSVRVVRRINYRADTLGWRGDSHRHIFIVGLDDSNVRQLTSGDWDDSGPRWSPNGAHIAFISARRTDRELVSFNEAYVMPATGGEPVVWSQGLSSVGAIAWSPEGRRLVAVASDDPEIGALWQGWLFILEPGKDPIRLTDDSVKPAAGFPPTISPPSLRWTEDGYLVFLADSRGESYLCQVPAQGGGLRKITNGGMQLSDLTIDAKGERAVVLGASPTSAGDLYLVDISAGTQRPLTHVNAEYFEEHPPATLRKESRSRAGMEIESRLLLPPDFDEARTYPLVVDIHGGPHGAFYDAFNTVQQVLATAGYLVLCVNPRGSSTYGADFVKAVLRDWGGEDYRDIMEAVDKTCDLPYVDSTRLGVHGYSYGGYMSSWIVGHTTRFQAAVVGAPCIDLSSMYGTSDIGVAFGEQQWGGPRHQALEAYQKHSPLTYAHQVETPVMLLHGEADHRCPIEQSEQYFVALRRLGKEVEFVRFPDSSHLFVRAGHPKMRQEYLQRTLGWFDRHLRPQAEAEA